MLLSDRYGFVFVKTRKTAGTSVEIALSRHLGPDDVITAIEPAEDVARFGGRGPQHDRLPLRRYRRRDVRQAIGERRLLRCPSHLPMSKIRRWYGEERIDALTSFAVVRDPFDRAVSLHAWRARALADPPPLDRFVLEAPARDLSTWHLLAVDGELAVDAVVRYEHLLDDLAGVLAPLGFPMPVELPRAKAGVRADRGDPRDALGPAAVERIATVCRRELDAFGYPG